MSRCSGANISTLFPNANMEGIVKAVSEEPVFEKYRRMNDRFLQGDLDMPQAIDALQNGCDLNSELKHQAISMSSSSMSRFTTSANLCGHLSVTLNHSSQRVASSSRRARRLDDH